MTTVRVDSYVGVQCDGCQAVSQLVESQSGWRNLIDGGWRFWGMLDVQLCPACARKLDTLKRERPTRPDPPGSEGA